MEKRVGQFVVDVTHVRFDYRSYTIGWLSIFGYQDVQLASVPGELSPDEYINHPGVNQSFDEHIETLVKEINDKKYAVAVLRGEDIIE